MFSRGSRFAHSSRDNNTQVTQGSQLDSRKRSTLPEKVGRPPRPACADESGEPSPSPIAHAEAQLKSRLHNTQQDELGGTKLTGTEALRAKLSRLEREHSQLQIDLSNIQKKNREKDAKIARLEKLLVQENKPNSRNSHTVDRDSNSHSPSGSEEPRSQEHTLSTQLEQCRDLLTRVTEEYGRLSRSTVSQSSYDQLKQDYTTQLMRTLRLSRKLGDSKAQVVELAQLTQRVKEENQLLNTQLDEAQDLISYYQSILGTSSSAISEPPETIYPPDEELQYSQDCNNAISTLESRFLQLVLLLYTDSLLDHAQTDAQLHIQTRVYDAHLADTEAESSALRTQVIEAHDKYKQAESQLEIQMSAAIREKMQLNDSQTLLRESEQRIRSLTSSHHEALAKEREIIKRLKTSLNVSRGVEEGLRAEIEQLAGELTDAEPYREAYFSLSDELDNLVARNALAEDESESLRKLNAQILGHKNPAQRVMYLDKVRTELATTKQSLLVALRERDAAYSMNRDLSEELSLYKSVSAPESRPRTNVTRLARQPAPQKMNPGQSSMRRLAEHLPPSTELEDA